MVLNGNKLNRYDKELIILFSKTPKQGVVKTRLANTLGNKIASKIAEAMLIDCLTNIPGNYDIWINISSSCSKVGMERIISIFQKLKKIKVICTPGKTIDEQILSSYNEGFKAGYKKILITASDTLDFFDSDIAWAFNALDKYDAVLYPTFDGGICPHALKNFKLALIFSNNSTRKNNIIYTATNVLKKLKGNYIFGRTVFDIDTFDDLQRYYYFFKSGVYSKDSSNETFNICQNLFKKY